MKTILHGVPQHDIAYSGDLSGGLVNPAEFCHLLKDMKGKMILAPELVRWNSECAVVAAVVAAQGTKKFCTKVLNL